MVTTQELRAGGALAGDVLAAGVDVVRDVHRAIAGRVFRALPRVALPVRLVHDAVAGIAYASVRAGHAVTPRAAAVVAAPLLEARQPGRQPLAAAAEGRLALGALNGLWGDHVARRYPPLALHQAFRVEGSEVAVSPEGIARAYAEPSGRLVLFVHGLCESEESWSLAAQRRHGDRGVTYGSLLRDHLGFTPLYLRYNSGRHISDNAQDLADLLERLVQAWPVPVDEVVLIGHSMGGLVVRGACHHGTEAGHAWTERVRHVVCLGTPHLGAPLERAVNAMASLLSSIPETEPVARILNTRSAGVKDLRYGACVEADWLGHDPDELLRDRCTEVPMLPHAAFYFVAATVLRDATLATEWLGDLLVNLPSASGRGARRQVPFAPGNGAHLGGLHHLDLLNHPEVYAHLGRWLSEGPAHLGAYLGAHLGVQTA